MSDKTGSLCQPSYSNCFPNENEIVQRGSSFDLCLVCIECICVTHIFVLWVDSPMPTSSHADSKMQAVRPQRLAMLAQLASWRANANSYFLIRCTNIRKKNQMNLGGLVLGGLVLASNMNYGKGIHIQ